MTWRRRHWLFQCLRMNYVPEPEKIEQGVAILAEEVERARKEAGI
ncbi:hypothetical protein [Dickeya fangzhongdai]